MPQVAQGSAAHKQTFSKAIASLIVTIINVLGGLAIGVGQRDLEVTAALKRYGLLTIGDGLVTQIPALVMTCTFLLGRS